MEQFSESSWIYIMLVVLGFLFRTALYNPFETNSAMNRRNTLIQIGMIISITLWMGGNHVNNSKTIGGSFLLFIGYCVYALRKKIGHIGFTDGILVVIDGYLITALSFMSFPSNTILVIVTMTLSILVYKHGGDEKKYDLWSIILSCVEALILSCYIWWKNKDGLLDTMLIVVFVETFIFMINCLAKFVFVKLCNADADEYWNMLRGIDVDSY